MAETPMCAAEMMAKAAFQRGSDAILPSVLDQNAWERFKQAHPANAQSKIEDMRAALRALAEMYGPEGERKLAGCFPAADVLRDVAAEGEDS